MTMPSIANLPTSAAASVESPTFDLSNPQAVIEQLRSTRNSVIGSRTKKTHLVNSGAIREYVRLVQTDLSLYPQAPEIVVLAATIIASLANTPAHQTLLKLLRAGAHDALLTCLKNLVEYLKLTGQHLLTPSNVVDGYVTVEPLKLLEALLRALRSILLAIADQLSASPRWGIGSAWGTKPVSTGVAISNLNPTAGGTKIFGTSSRETLNPNSFGLAQQPESDVLMARASQDDLRATANAFVDSQDDEEHELRLLARTFLARTYSSQNLPYLLGPMFVCNVPRQNSDGSSSSLIETRDVNMNSRPGPTSGALSPSLHSTSASISCSHKPTLNHDGPTDLEIDVERLPLSTRSRILSIIEMICATLAGTVYIPGPGPTDTISVYDDARTPEAEIQLRQRRVLDFVAGMNPFSLSASATDVGEDARGREEGSSSTITNHKARGFQAEVIRKASRPRSHVQDSFHDGSELNYQTLTQVVDDKPTFSASLAPRQTRNVLSVLLAAAECGYVKVQDAALWCLAELTRESAEASERLFRCSTVSGALPTSMLLNLRKSLSPNVRLAAFCCLSHIIKVHPFTPKTNQCVLEVLVELMDQKAAASGTLQAQGQIHIQVQAAFAVARLVSNDVELQTLAADSYGAIETLTNLLEKACNSCSNTSKAGVPGSAGIVLPSPTLGVAPPAVDEGSIRLREACLTALAALAFQQDDLRRKMVDAGSPPLLSLVVPCLDFPALGVRVAACRLLRSLSRSISILRTSLVDAGVAEKLLELINDEEEDESVKVEATAAICNLVLNFSPVKKLVTDLGGVEKLISIAKAKAGPTSRSVRANAASATTRKGQQVSESEALRLNALWAIKNILWASESETKSEIMDKLGWELVVSLATEGEMLLREQAVNILRNVADGAKDISMMMQGVGGANKLLDMLEKVIWDCKDSGSEGASVIEQVAYCMVNVATGTDEHRRMLLRRPNLMDALMYFTNHPWKDIRGAATWCVINLTYRPIGIMAVNSDGSDVDISAEAILRLRAFGMEDRLRSLSKEETDLDVRERARAALTKFEMNGSSISGSLNPPAAGGGGLGGGAWLHSTMSSNV